MCIRDSLFSILRSLGMPCSSQSQGAFFHRLSDQAIHSFLFCRSCRSLFETTDDPLDLLRRYAGGDVNGYPAVHDLVEITGEGFPIGLDAVTFAMLGAILLEDRAFQRRHRLAFACLLYTSD